MFFNFRRCFALSAITLASLSLTGCFTDEIDARQTHEIQGLLYKIHDSEPFSGRVLNYPMSVLGVYTVGTCAVDFSKGLPDGELSCSDNAGTVVATGEFTKGKRNGLEEKFDAKTGKKTVINHWVNGLQDGVQEQFDLQSGERLLEVHYTAGKKDGRERAWDIRGEQMVDLEWENGLQSGFDNRGTEHRTYLNGKLHGPQKTFSVNGNMFYVAREENFENGLPHGVQKRIDGHGNVTELSVFDHDKLRSRTVDKYDYTGKHLHHYSSVALKDDVNRYMESDMSKDGAEQYWDTDGHLVRELQWSKGKLLSAIATVWVGDHQDSQFRGVIRPGYGDQQMVFKHGQERLFNAQGELDGVIFWDSGKISQILAALPADQRSQYPGKMGVVVAYSSDPSGLFSEPSNYNGVNARYVDLVDIPAPGQVAQTSNAPADEPVTISQVDTSGDVDSCVQGRIDAVHAENSDALVRADMLEEFKQECL